MMRLIKFLLGLVVGATAGVLFAPKSGRELREQLLGGAAAKVLPPMAERYPLPESSYPEPENTAPLEQPPIAAPSTETPAAIVGIVEEPLAVAPEATGEDLLARIAVTRAAVEAELAEPFGPAPAEESAPTPEPTPALEPAPTAAPALYWELTPEPVATEEPAPQGGELEDLWADETDHTAAMPVETPAPPAISEAPNAEPIAEAEEPQSEIEPAAVLVEPSVAEQVAAVEEPAAEIIADTVVMEPATTTPAWEAPTPAMSEEPAMDRGPVTPAETPGGGGAVDQAEMRRRIEETRARLKAKAFDAMMSGESALLRNDSGTRTVPASDGASLAPDIDSTIDESLSPEDA